MVRCIILLANSFKTGERCMAGVEIVKNQDEAWVIAQNFDGSSKWIRPVSNSEFGEIPANIANKYKLLDTVSMEVIREVPKGFQSENCLIEPTSLKRLDSIRYSKENLGKLVNQRPQKLFGNKGKAVSVDVIGSVAYSLILIEPIDFVASSIQQEDGKVRKRGEFKYKDNTYDLPITDVNFVVDSEVGKQCFLTISLGVEHNGWHSKLIAGVMLS